MPAGLREHDTEEAHHRRGDATVAAAVGGQPRSEAVWGRRTGGVEHVGLRARTLHETGNWLVLTDCSNAFNTVKRKAVLGEAANCVPALTLFVTKCYGTRLADVFFRMESEETRTIACSNGVQQGHPMGPAVFCLAYDQG